MWKPLRSQLSPGPCLPPCPPRRPSLWAPLAAALAVLLVTTACSSWRTEELPADGGIPELFKVRAPVAFEMIRDNPNMPVLDLRSLEAFEGPIGHIRGAYHLPLEELDRRIPELRALEDRTFLIYCEHDDCGDRGLRQLFAAGFTQAILLEGGIDAWVFSGFGTVVEPRRGPAFEEAEVNEVIVE